MSRYAQPHDDARFLTRVFCLLLISVLCSPARWPDWPRFAAAWSCIRIFNSDFRAVCFRLDLPVFSVLYFLHVVAQSSRRRGAVPSISWKTVLRRRSITVIISSMRSID